MPKGVVLDARKGKGSRCPVAPAARSWYITSGGGIAHEVSFLDLRDGEATATPTSPA